MFTMVLCFRGDEAKDGWSRSARAVAMQRQQRGGKQDRFSIIKALNVDLDAELIAHSGEVADRTENKNQLVYQKGQSDLTDKTNTGWAHSCEGSLIMNFRNILEYG